MISNIVQDINELKTLCEQVSSEEGEQISSKLFNELTAAGNGIGLAANQIGINKRVCVINVKQPIALINPVIIEKSEEKFIFPESCLSFPGKHIRTERHVSVKVKADNHPEVLSFTAESKDVNDAFECVCVQHEIDHLDGITMFDRQYINKPIVNGVNAPAKIGRNEKVTITDGNETKVVKYKKALPLIENGNWKLSDIQINV
tara:strand:- start:233 stop:841 length:609 start_codon:yes stop_codon:yes gene_type:complete